MAMYSKFEVRPTIVNQITLLFTGILYRYWNPITLFLVGLVTWLSLRIPVDSTVAVPGNDKLHHLVAYAVLAFPAAWVRPRYCTWCLVSIFIWSGLIEIVQPWFSREMDILDLLANSTGLLLGFISARGVATLVPTNRPSGVY